MTLPTRKGITHDFIRSKRPCTDGYRWNLQRQETLSDVQALLADLVAAGRPEDANGCWTSSAQPTTCCTPTNSTRPPWCSPVAWSAVVR